MTDSNINSLLNNEEEKDETLLDTTQIKSNTESLLDRIEQKSFTPNLDQNIFKTQAKVVDFFDNKFLGNQRSFEEILENRSRIVNESIKKKEETDKQITKTATSQVIRGAITGPVKAINETVEFVDDIYDYLAGNPYDNNDLIDTSNFEREDDGAFYQIPQAITQFLLPMGIFTKGLKGIKNPWTRNLVAGFLTDFVVEDPFEQNLYNMVDSYEGMLEPVVDILKMPASIFKAEDDISPIEARLRKAFGGAVIGEALTGLSVGLKAFRNSKLAPEVLRTLEAKQRLKFKDLGIDQAGNELLDEKVIDLIKPLNVKQTSDDVLKTPRVGEKIESTFNPKITGGGIQSLRESLLNISEYFRDTDEFGQWARSVSLQDMFNASQRQSRGQALEAARFFLQEFGPFKKTRNGNIINNPQYLPATTISVNQMMNKNGEEVYNLSVALHNAIVTKNLDAIKEIRSDFIEETKVLKGLVYLNKGVGSLTSQSLGARRAAGGLRDAKTTAQDFGVRSGTEDINSINRNFIEDTGADEIDETFNKIFDLVEKGDEEAALSLTRLTKYLHIAGGNPEVLKKMIKKGFIERGVEFTNEIYINSILSGPPTHVVNILSTGLNTLIKPLTQSAGAFKVTATDSFGKKVFRPEFNTEEFIKGWKQFIYMYQSLGDAFNVAGKAFKVNENVLDRAAMVQDARRVSRNINGQDVTNFADSNALTRNAIKPFVDFTNADAWLPSIYNNFRRINGFGSRLLITEDEFYKQVNFRAYVKSDAWEKGVKAGKTGNALTKYIEKQSNKVFDIVDTGSTKGLPPSITDLYKKAKDYAAEVTFTKDLPQDGFGKTIQNFANHPFGRLIVPFVRTPINIFKTQLRFIPGFNYALLGEYRRALKSTDPSVAARARGEMYLGGGFTSMALLLARDVDNPMAEVSFTGGGPNTVGFGDVIEQNRLLVKQKRAEGWQPYSFRFLVRDKNGEVVMTKSGKPKYKYISYKRLDPWSGIFMLLGDYADIEGQIGQQQRNDFAVAMTVAIARNLTDRTFVSGITEFAEAIHNPFKLQTLLSRRVANIVNPVSSFGRSVNKAIDKTKLDTSFYPKGSEEMFTGVRSFLNELAKTVPLYNADLQPDRNWLTGAVIEYPNGVGPDIFDVLNPFTATNTKDNLVLTVINDLNISLQPPKKFFFREQGVEGTGIELDNDQYADYIKHLAFDTKIDGKRLIVKLFEELNKPQNKAFYQTALGQNIDADDARLKMQIQDNARAELASLIRSTVGDYKDKAKKGWFRKPENRKIYSDYQDKLTKINDNTTKATIKNYNKNIVDFNSN